MDYIEEFFYVNLTSSWICVGRAAVMLLLEQYERGDKVLKFDDLYGRESYIASKDFESAWWSTPETREAVRKHNKTIHDEDPDANKKEWEGGSQM